MRAAPVGIGWRHPHHAELLQRRPALDFIEVHSENFFADGGASLSLLLQARAHYPVSLHGVGLSLGSADGLDAWHLRQLKRLVAAVQPRRVSDHASFARVRTSRGVVHAADLLPLPHSAQALDVLVGNVQRVQDALGQPIAVENISAYLRWAPQADDLSEVEFLLRLHRRTGCSLLLDVNNLYVNALNELLAQHEAAPLAAATEHSQAALHKPRDRANTHALARNAHPADAWAGEPHAAALWLADRADAALATCRAWLDALPPGCVSEIHLAGHTLVPLPTTPPSVRVIDDHGRRVCAPVWALYRYALAHLGPIDTLIEWDTHIPALDVLLDEAAQARRLSSEDKP